MSIRSGRSRAQKWMKFGGVMYLLEFWKLEVNSARLSFVLLPLHMSRLTKLLRMRFVAARRGWAHSKGDEHHYHHLGHLFYGLEHGE